MKIQEHKSYTYTCESCKEEYEDKECIYKCNLCKDKEICEECSYGCEECKKRFCEYHILYYNEMNVCHACVINIQNGERLHYHYDEECSRGEAIHLPRSKSIFMCGICDKNQICIHCTEMCYKCLSYGWCKECNNRIKICPECNKELLLR